MWHLYALVSPTRPLSPLYHPSLTHYYPLDRRTIQKPRSWHQPQLCTYSWSLSRHNHHDGPFLYLWSVCQCACDVCIHLLYVCVCFTHVVLLLSFTLTVWSIKSIWHHSGVTLGTDVCVAVEAGWAVTPPVCILRSMIGERGLVDWGSNLCNI